MPNAFSSALRPSAATTPSPRPISEATSPVSAASPSTEPNSCRRLAPTTRSSASSRVRCPTVIENVLKIVKPPTNSEINAKINSAVEMNESSLLTAVESSLATVCPLTTCTPGWQDRGDRPLQLDGVGPGRSQDADRVVVPVGIEQRLRRRRLESGERHPRQVVVATERDEPGDRERLRPIGQVHEHPVTQGEVVLGRRRLVHHHVIGGGGRMARDQPVRGQLRVGVERESQRRAAALADRVPVRAS